VTEAVKPSDVAAVPTTSVRRLTITATVPVAGSGDTVGALVIPAGLNFTTADPLSSLTSLDVKGSLTADAALLSRLETLTVSGSLTAASASYTKVKALTVGAEFAVTRDLGALETLTVTAGGAFEGVGVGGTEGVTITVASGASAEVGAITNLKPSTIEGALIATSYTVYGAGGTPAPGTPLSVAAGGTVNGITFPAPVKVAAVAAGSATIEGITIEEDQLLTIPASATLVIAAGAPGTGETPAENLFVYEGQVVIEATGKLVLATASTANVGRIKGTGTITAGTTTITGAWEAVAATSDAGTLTILGAATGATITADGTNATGLKAGAAGAAITQAVGASNNLSIGANTVINLDGTDAAAVGKLVLTGDGTNPGKLTLTDTSTVQCGSPTLGTPYSSAAKIGGKTFDVGSTADVYTAANTDAAGKFGGIKGSSGDKTFIGGDATNTIEIDSTKEVAD
ncbi:MAG: hypothetical protein LBG25_01055, partial [Spirochaetaceae bacterium]|nr:hypothetical protein [Spirochaetaceae bacterium]